MHPTDGASRTRHGARVRFRHGTTPRAAFGRGRSRHPREVAGPGPPQAATTLRGRQLAASIFETTSARDDKRGCGPVAGAGGWSRPAHGSRRLRLRYGFSVLSDAVIERAGRALAKEATAPAQVFLFGSHARGDATADSDLDFLVVERGAEPTAEGGFGCA